MKPGGVQSYRMAMWGKQDFEYQIFPLETMLKIQLKRRVKLRKMNLRKMMMMGRKKRKKAMRLLD